MKRLWALLTALLLMIGCAQAQEIPTAPIATYTLPQGAEALPLWETGDWDIPEGLEGMYALMQKADFLGNVYLARMPHGRAVVSVSCMKPEHLYSADELLGLWPQIATNIAKEGVSVDAGEACASIENLYGFDALHIQTEITIGSWGNGLALNAEGIAFYRGEEFLEVWAVAPKNETWQPDDPAAKELAEDLRAMHGFMQSLSFTNLESMAVTGVPYSDPDGRFALLIPSGSTVITLHASQEEIAAAREAYLAAHEPGADKLFDEYMSDVISQKVTLILSPDQQAAVEIFASQEEDFRDLTADQLLLLAQPIQKTLSEKFDAALLLESESDCVISGQKHARLTYWLRSGEANAQLDVMAAVLDDAWLCEVDLFTHDGKQDLRLLWHTLITRTLHYTPLQNALDE